jgi:hypothetical protein
MNYTYKEIQGNTINRDCLSLRRAASLAKVIMDNPSFYLNPEFRSRADGAEIILVTLDIEIYQKAYNSIKEHEEIAIICYPQDENFPEVFALRNDFQLGLPHTNLRKENYPVSLCITEQLFQEIKHTFNPYEFIESIRRWLSLTSQNKLHAKDQALEPFFISKGYIITPNIEELKSDHFYIEQMAPDSILYKIQNEENKKGGFFCIKFDADEQTSGFIRREPQVIKDLSEFVVIKSIDFTTTLANCFNKISQNLLKDKELHEKSLMICCIVPVKRDKKDIQPERFEILFFALQKTIREMGIESGVWSEGPDKMSLVPLIGKTFTKEYISFVPIETYSIIPDYNKFSASLYNNIKPEDKKYSLIGVGALGSQVLELFARMGFGKWGAIDHDSLYPHNLARHILCRDAIGYNKAEKMAEHLNQLLGEEFCIPYNINILQGYKQESIVEQLKESHAIIDISTSISVGRLLARDYQDKISACRISMFLSPDGQDLVILAEDKKRKHRLDFLEMEYYRFLYRNEALHDHLQFDEDTKIRYNRNSCREITSKINQADVSLLASIGVKALQIILEKGEPDISIWRINRCDVSVKHYTTDPTKWIKKNTDGWKVYLNRLLIEEMESSRTKKLPKETGGILLGTIDMERKIIYVYDNIQAPEDSDETTSSFERGISGVTDIYEKYRKITDNQIQYLGEWHSHPDGYSTNPSSLDKKLFNYLSENLSKQGLPTLMAILGNKDCTILVN